MDRGIELSMRALVIIMICITVLIVIIILFRGGFENVSQTLGDFARDATQRLKGANSMVNRDFGEAISNVSGGWE